MTARISLVSEYPGISMEDIAAGVGQATRHAIEVVDDEICGDVITIEMAEDGHITDVVIPAAAYDKRIPLQDYIDQMKRDYAPLAMALRR